MKKSVLKVEEAWARWQKANANTGFKISAFDPQKAEVVRVIIKGDNGYAQVALEKDPGFLMGFDSLKGLIPKNRVTGDANSITFDLTGLLLSSDGKDLLVKSAA